MAAGRVKKRLLVTLYTSAGLSFEIVNTLYKSFYNAGGTIVYRFKNPANKIKATI